MKVASIAGHEIQAYSAMFSLILSLLLGGCGGSVTAQPNANSTSGNGTTNPQSRNNYNLTTGRSPGNIITNNNLLFWSEQSQTPINRISLLDGQSPVALASTIGVVKDYRNYVQKEGIAVVRHNLS